MKQIISLLSFIFMLCPMVVSAQEADTIQVTKQAKERTITGTLIDKESKEGIMQVTIQLLKADSTFVTGSISDMDEKHRKMVSISSR